MESLDAQTKHRVLVTLATSTICFILNRLSYFLSSAFSKTYQKANYANRAEWNLRWVAMVNGTFATVSSVYLMLAPEVYSDKVFGQHSFFTEYFLPISIGYYVYDSLMNIYYLPTLKKYNTLLHHFIITWIAVYQIIPQTLIIFYHAVGYFMAVTDLFFHTNYLLLHSNANHRQSSTFKLLYSLHYWLFFVIRIIIMSWLIFGQEVMSISDLLAALAKPFSSSASLFQGLVAFKNVIFETDVKLFVLMRVCFGTFQALNFYEFYTMTISYYNNVFNTKRKHKHSHSNKKQPQQKNTQQKNNKKTTKKQA